jgi:hypothetical protein
MITLDNSRIALTLDPGFGARVMSLTDLASGRQWLVPGDCLGGDSYLGDQARGWDECFPTVGTCSHPAWGDLRDHGLLWGLAWTVTGGRDTCTATFDDPRFTFSRSLRLQDATPTADYRLTNKRTIPLPYLWSQHALLATTPADRITLHGMAAMRAGGQPFTWPDHRARDLSAIGTGEEGFALKAYADTPGAASAEVTGPTGGIRFDWIGADVPAFGLWLDYGGWPAGAPVHQVALEPATAPADDLAQAERMGRARTVTRGETHIWSVRISMTPPSAPASA